MTDGSGRSATRGPRRGLVWQDWYAASVLLRAWSEPRAGIRAVEVEAKGAQPIDDVVVHFDDKVRYYQLKHSVDPDARFTGSQLLSPAGGESPLLRNLYDGWRKVRGKWPEKHAEVHLLTNVPAAVTRRTALATPDELVSELLEPLRDSTRSLSGRGQELLEQTRTLLGCTPADGQEFLKTLYIEFEVSGIDALKAECVGFLERALRSKVQADIDAKAWASTVTDLATLEDTGVLTWDDIDREVRRTLHCPRIPEHRLVLPSHHVERQVFADGVVAAATSLGSGYLRVLGEPGCGKTTLATWIADRHEDIVLARYHCFDPTAKFQTEIERARRAGASHYSKTLLDVLAERFPDVVPATMLAEDAVTDAASRLYDLLGELASGRTRLVIVDGIDHVVRTRSTEPLFAALPQPAPPNVVFVLFGQPNWPYPEWLDRTAVDVAVPPFNFDETLAHVSSRMGWAPDDPLVRGMAAALHDRSAGNPLSLFYNLTTLAALGSEPADVAEALGTARLFGKDPHAEYDRLLDDVGRAIPVPNDSRSLRRELLACIGVAGAAITASRLVRAFGRDPMSDRQAQDILEGLQPVLVEAGAGQFRLFHDDFRRYAEGRTGDADRVRAHERFGRALEKDWTGSELAAYAEHLWLGRADAELAEFPAKHELADLMARAPPWVVADAFRLALAAALRAGLDMSTFENCLGAIRAAEIADTLGLLGESEESSGERLTEWTFRQPPVVATAELHVRADALNAAAAGYSGAPEVAAALVRRFELPGSRLGDEDVLNDHSWHEYATSLTRWLLATGDAAGVARLIVAESTAWQALRAVGLMISGPVAPDVAEHWTLCAAGKSPYADWTLDGAAISQILAGRESSAKAIVDAMAAVGVTSAAARRSVAAIASLLEGANRFTPPTGTVGIRLPEHSGSDPENWRDYFFAGMAAAALGEVSDMTLSGCPAAELERVVQSHRRAVDLVWRTGVASGLAIRNPGLLPATWLRRLMDSFSGKARGRADFSEFFAIQRAATVYVPLLGLSTRNDPELREALLGPIREYVLNSIDETAGYADPFRETLWMLDQDAWRASAVAAFGVEAFPGAGGHGRASWHRYWQHRAAERGVDVPSSFADRAAVSALCSERKTNPASWAVELLERLPRDSGLPARIETLVDLLIQMSGEDEGGRPAYRQIRRVLAVAFVHDPALFEREFIRALGQHGVAEPFGDVAFDVAQRVLESDRPLSAADLLALWHWVVACPGTLDGDSDLEHFGRLVQDRSLNLGLLNLVERVAEFLGALPPSAKDKSPAEDLEAAEPEPQVTDMTGTWFSSWYSRRRYEALKAYVARGGARAWEDVGNRLATRIAETEDIGTYEIDCIADGIVELRPLDKSAAFKAACEHLWMKVRFQDAPDPRPPSEGGEHDASVAAVLVRLIARGLEVADCETATRAHRALGALARDATTASAVERTMMLRLDSDDSSLVISALAILRQAHDLASATLAKCRSLREHPDAWCRWLASSICDENVVWSPTRMALTPPGLLILKTENAAEELGSVYVAGTRGIQAVYARKLAELSPATAEEVAHSIDAEFQLMPPGRDLPTGWKYRRGRVLVQDPMSDAARRYVARFVSTLPDPVVPAALGATALFDPWLAVAPDFVAPPHGWSELCRVEHDAGALEREQVVRTLVLIQSLPDWLTEAQLAELALESVWPVFPKDYAWVAEPWPGAVAPELPRAPVCPLAFWNRTFMRLERAQFDLVPRWDLPIFGDLHFGVDDRPHWRSDNAGRVVVAARGERVRRRSSGGEHAAVGWWTGWYASPAWLQLAVPSGFTLYRVWRRERQVRASYTAVESHDGEVTYGAEKVTL
jgi:hypothetical protein